MTPTLELFIEGSSRMVEDEYPARSARSSQSATVDSGLSGPTVKGLLRENWLSEPNWWLSSDASGRLALVRSPTMKENDPSLEVNASLRPDPLQTRITAAGAGGSMPVSSTTLP